MCAEIVLLNKSVSCLLAKGAQRLLLWKQGSKKSIDHIFKMNYYFACSYIWAGGKKMLISNLPLFFYNAKNPRPCRLRYWLWICEKLVK